MLSKLSLAGQPATGRAWALMARLAPWLLLSAFLAWGWRFQDLVHAASSEGDVTEQLWLISWYGEAISAGVNPGLYPLAFYPEGWHVAATGQSVGLWLYLALQPLYRLAGAAFAYNIAVLGTFVLAFAGAYRLARRSMDGLSASVVALLVTFWGHRWFQTIGHLNVLLGSALLPWMAWSLDRALDALLRRQWRWMALVGICWAVAIAASLYFVWLGGILLATWLLGRLLAREITWRSALLSLGAPALVALTLSAPGIIAFWQATQAAGVGFFSLTDINYWGASLNALPAPYIYHPWLREVAGLVYRGIPYEQATTNLGPVACLMALRGWSVRRERRLLALPLLAVTGMVLSLGLTLKWDNLSVQWSALAPLNRAIWWLGHQFKPDVFAAEVSPLFVAAVPLPGLLLSAVVPFFEGGRVFARYAFLGSLGVFMLAGLALARLRVVWLRWLLVGALLIEVVPPPLRSEPFPPDIHPAFTWLRQQDLGEQAIADLTGPHPYTATIHNHGSTVLATMYHGKPTVAGASSLWPPHNLALYKWLGEHEHVMGIRRSAAVLRMYGVRYLLLHMGGKYEPGILEEARQNPELRFVQCFAPVGAGGPWGHEICVLEVLPAPNPQINLALGDEWSPPEDWGAWSTATEAHAFWMAIRNAQYTLVLEGFPMCVPGQSQNAAVEVNGVEISRHQWTDCEPWSVQVAVPASLTRIGQNDVVLRTSYVARPADVTNGKNPDTRALSMGVSRLQINEQR